MGQPGRPAGGILVTPRNDTPRRAVGGAQKPDLPQAVTRIRQTRVGTGGPAPRQNRIVVKVAVCSKPIRSYAARAGAFQSLT